MALDSIAKLSILITGDDAPLSRATKRAEDNVRRFAAVGNSMGAMSLLKNLAGAAGFGGVAGAVAVATAATIRFTSEAVRGAIEVESAAAKMNKSWTDTERRFRTTAGQWEIFKQGVTTPVKDNIGSVLNRDLREMLTVLNVATGAIKRFKAEQAPGADLTAVDIVKSRYDQLVARAKEQGGKLVAHEAAEARQLADELKRRRVAEWWRQSDKDIADTQHRIGLQMEEQARQLKATLLTPLEAFEAKLDELRQLQDAGLIGADMMRRATEKARADMDAAIQVEKDLRRVIDKGPGGAVERFTAQGFSAMQAGGIGRDSKVEEKQLVRQNQEMIGVMKQIDAKLATKKDWPFQMSQLN